MNWLLGFIVAMAVVSPTFVLADDEVQSAIKSFREMRQKQDEVLEAALERKVQEFRRTGNLSQLEVIQAELNRFKTSGELPSSSLMKNFVDKHSRAVAAARAKVLKTYETRIKALTRAGKLDEAQALVDEQEHLDERLAKESPAPDPASDDLPVSSASAPGAAYDRLPSRVRVLPIAFIPKDQKPPSATEQSLYLRHLTWAQKRYGELLGGDTFEFAANPIELRQIRGRRVLADYRSASEGGAPEIVAEILDSLQLNRFENPYTFAILLMNAVDRFPLGGGRPINGGTNGGGGMFYIGSGELVQNPHFQCTLQHELGHSFGLAHVDMYGYSMDQNMSLMSYNPAHHNRGFEPSPTPGILNPEDVRVLALNDRTFEKTAFDVRRNVPAGYTLFRYVIALGPMNLPGHPSFYPTVKTNVESFGGSRPETCLYEVIRPSEGPNVTYNSGTMWHTEHQFSSKHAQMDISFPFPVEIDGLGIHTQHSAMDHHATHIRVQATDGVSPTELADQDLQAVDAEIAFTSARSRRWRLELTPGPSKTIVVRGIRFLKGGKEIYPRMAPYGNLQLIP